MINRLLTELNISIFPLLASKRGVLGQYHTHTHRIYIKPSIRKLWGLEMYNTVVLHELIHWTMTPLSRSELSENSEEYIAVRGADLLARYYKIPVINYQLYNHITDPDINKYIHDAVLYITNRVHP